MSLDRNSAIRIIRHLGPRAFWLLLILIHIPAFIGATNSLLATPDFFHIASLIALVITVGCFVLKLFGYRFIKQGNVRTRALIFLVIVSLVHPEAAISSVEKLLDSPAPVVAAVLVIGETFRRAHKHLPSLRRKLASIFSTRLIHGYLAALITIFDHITSGPRDAFRPAIPRGPPA